MIRNVHTDASFDFLVQRRKELGLTKGDIAERLGKSYQTVTNYENGNIANNVHTRMEKFKEIAEAYEVDIEVLKQEYEKARLMLEDIKNATFISLRGYFNDICNGVKASSMIEIDGKTLNRIENKKLADVIDASLKRQLSDVASNIYDILYTAELTRRGI